MNQDCASLEGRRPGLSLVFLVEHAAVVARLQFRIAIEVSKRGKIANDSFSIKFWGSVAALLCLNDNRDDVDYSGNGSPIAPSDAVQPLGKEPPVTGHERAHPDGCNNGHLAREMYQGKIMPLIMMQAIC
jgi:hypothetical protein